MPENPVFMPHHRLLPPDQLLSLVASLLELGLREIRVTGGEPTLRPEFGEIMEGLGALRPESLALTTNGLSLQRHLPVLLRSGCHRINVSMDSLDEGRYHSVTRGGDLRKVLAGVFAAKEQGLSVKINVVVMKGVNDDELEDFARWSESTGIQVRFLETLKIGVARDFYEQRFLPAAAMRSRLQASVGLEPLANAVDATARAYSTQGGGVVGFIASESEPFCSDCSRMRLSPTGKLRACLMSEDGLSLVDVSKKDLPKVLAEVLAMKPLGRIEEIAQAMHQIGG
jgi:cyclic pyranopterin phosphate synthase